jgi:lantibiotic modifying enzyme
MLQEHRLHPDRLRQALELDRLYDKLWAGVRQFPDLSRVVSAECQDLHQDDYPIFTTRPDSTALWTSTGSQLDDFLTESGLQLVERRVAQLDERDLDRQTRFIRTALTDYGSQVE